MDKAHVRNAGDLEHFHYPPEQCRTVTARRRSRDVHDIGGGFCYEGDGKFDWQRDFFDFGHITARCQKHFTAGKMIESMLKRLKNARRNRSRR